MEKKWAKPVLIVITRDQDGNNCLSACKTAFAIGPGGRGYCDSVISVGPGKCNDYSLGEQTELCKFAYGSSSESTGCLNPQRWQCRCYTSSTS